jgi:hypothetical protein
MRNLMYVIIYLVDMGWIGVDWIGLAQNMCKWSALVNEVVTIWYHKMLGNNHVAAKLGAS